MSIETTISGGIALYFILTFKFAMLTVQLLKQMGLKMLFWFSCSLKSENNCSTTSCSMVWTLYRADSVSADTVLLVGAVYAVILASLIGTRFIPRDSPIWIFSSSLTLWYTLRLHWLVSSDRHYLGWPKHTPGKNRCSGMVCVDFG